MKPEKKRYYRSFLLSMATYVAAMVAINIFIDLEALSKWQVFLLTLIPVTPICFWVRAELIYCRSWDELQKQQALEGVLFAFIVVGLGTFTYGIMEPAGFPPLRAIWIMPLLVVSQAVGRLIALRKYK